ncbi:MAG: DapH/DapD/GlmU-related protein [Erythrobacter sp.]|uniref:acyltransferase n=1 Tax=Erythrobacter sp. TaxID=1042 RepID=UPI003298058F
MKNSSMQSAVSQQSPRRKRTHSVRQRWNSFVRKYIWRMEIASDAWIAQSAYIDRTFPAGIHIEQGVVVEDEASVLTHDMTRGIYRDTHIGKNSVIGARAIIMPGLTIGANCIIDPGSVVIKDVSDNSHMRGNPAKPIGQLEE